jgi:hypothetical protein
MQLLGRLIAAEPRTFGGDWMRNPTAFSLVERRIAHTLAQLRPEGDPGPMPDHEVKGIVDRMLVAAGMIEPPAELQEDVP